MTIFTTQGFITLTGVTFTGSGDGTAGSQMQWTAINMTDFGPDSDNAINDVDSDGRLDAGTDAYLNIAVKFTGYTITAGGLEYGVFYDPNSGVYSVPLSQDGTTQTIIPTGAGTSNVYQAETGTNIFLCFAAGTEIATPSGATPVEALRTGDLICTSDGRTVAVLWLGHKTLRKWRYAERMQPVRIRTGALGGGLPHSDLTVTADHGMVIDGYVINASALVNGDTIAFVPMDEINNSFTVYHIETEHHEVILANGAASETFIDAVGRAAFDNHREYLDLYGAERIIREMPVPRIAAPRLVPQAIKDRLGVRSQCEMGWVDIEAFRL